MEQLERGFTPRFWALVGATFLGFLGIGAVLPGLAPQIRFELGGTDKTVGWVIGIFSFVALMSRFFSGPFADRRGRKLTFLVGLFSCALAGGAYLLPLGLAGAYLGRVLQGFGEACLYTGAATWVVTLAGVERSAQALGYLSSAIWGGICVGPAVGHWVGSFRHAAELQAFAALFALVLACFVHEEFQPSRPAAHRGLFPARLIRPGCAVGFCNVQYPVITGFLILHLSRHGNGGPTAFSVYALTILLSRFFLGKLPDKVAPSITFFGGITAMAVGLVILGAGPRPALAIAAAGLLGLGFSFPWSSVASTVLRQTPESEHGSTIGFLSAFNDLFVGLSSFAAGTVADRFGYGAAFDMAAVALLAAAWFAKFLFSPPQINNADEQDSTVLVTAGQVTR